MNRDPIVSALSIRLHRLIAYFGISFLVTLLIWAALLLSIWGPPIIGHHGVGWRVVVAFYRDLAIWLGKATWSALPAASDRGMAILWWGCVVLGCSLTLNLFLVIGRWWRRRSEVVFRRGARMLDTRPLGGG